MSGPQHPAHRSGRVRAWVAEQAAVDGVSVSIGLVCETAVRRLDMTGATLTVRNPLGWPETRYFTDRLGEQLTELLITVGEGPSLDVWREHGPILVDDLADPAYQRRWPAFAPLAVEAGARALFTLPLSVGAIQLGILALHRAEAGPMESGTAADSLVFAGMALTLLLDEHAGLPASPIDGAAGLPLHQPQVHQATGMIAAQLDVDMEDALARLRARAFADQRPLAELAGDVVARRLSFRPTEEAS